MTLCLCIAIGAQNKLVVNAEQDKEIISNLGESVGYDVHFQWGVVWSFVGDAMFSYDSDSSVDNASLRYRVLFKTIGFFDDIFRIRDTLDTYYNDRHELIYSLKCTFEGGYYYYVDKLMFTHDKENTKIHSLRYTPSTVNFDTVITAESNVTDLLGAVHYLRRLDRKKLKTGDTYPLNVVMGRNLVKIQFVYQNQAVLNIKKMKYDTHYFVINIDDKAFNSSKTSAEVWVGNDDNFLPIKARSKLKIGSVEVYYRESSNLAYPLTCSTLQ
jgi:hypothetical protein